MKCWKGVLILFCLRSSVFASVLSEPRVAQDLADYTDCTQRLRRLEKSVLSKVPSALGHFDRKFYYLSHGIQFFDSDLALVTRHLEQSPSISPARFVAVNGVEGCRAYLSVLNRHLRWAAGFWLSVVFTGLLLALRRFIVSFSFRRPAVANAPEPPSDLPR